MNETKKSSNRIILVCFLVVIACVLSFVGGIAYQKSTSKSLAASATATFATGGPNGQFSGRGRNGAFGSVTAVSSSSISINDVRQNTAKTYTVDANTAVTNSGAAASINDIKVGDEVVVQASSTDTKLAARIMLGAPGGGSFGGSQQSQDGPPSVQTN